MSTQEKNEIAQRELRRLGEGGAQDRLRFRLVLRVMLRCVPLLREVKWHLIAIVLAVTVLVLLLVYPSLQMFDMFWTRLLKGDAPTPQQCKLLSLAGVACDPWTHDARRAGLRALVVATTSVGSVVGVAFVSIAFYRIWILQQVNHVLRMRLLDRLQTLSLRFHSESSVGDAVYRMYQDSSMVTQLIDVLFLTPLRYGGQLLFALLWVTIWDPRLGLLFGLGWPVALYAGYRFSRPLRVAFRAAREQNSALTSLIQASLQGIRVIKAYGAEDREQARFEAQSKAAFAEAFASRDRFVVFRMVIFWVFGALVITAITWGAWLTTKEAPLFAKALMLLMGFSAWNLGLWNQFKTRIDGALSASTGLFDLWGRVQDIAIGLDRVFETLDLEPEVKDAPDAVELPPFTERVEFDAVSFSYDGARPTLTDASLVAKAGTITAIVGPTGSGKSTLMSLLLRLYDPDAGAIRIDGLDIRKVKLDSLRANISIALQENVLFSTTIRDNIRYAMTDASDEAVRAAARVAAADEFIEKLPQGYDTLLGERGTKLSTGQRQRLSIARAILKNTPILVLDEPTAALDAETELRVLDNLASWGRGRAVFLITHRLSTIRKADQVVFVQDGKLVEHGSHEALMQVSGGSYRKLVEGEDAMARALPQAAAS